MKTPQPPGAPNNLGVIATTCHSMQVAWDPPHETGVDIIGKWTRYIVRYSILWRSIEMRLGWGMKYFAYVQAISHQSGRG